MSVYVKTEKGSYPVESLTFSYGRWSVCAAVSDIWVTAEGTSLDEAMMKLSVRIDQATELHNREAPQ